MINAIINGILNVINFIVSLVLAPIDALVSNLFPTLTKWIGYFNIFVDRYLGDTIGYFASMLHPQFIQLLSVFLLTISTYYSVRFTYNNIIRLWNVIKKLKFW